MTTQAIQTITLEPAAAEIKAGHFVKFNSSGTILETVEGDEAIGVAEVDSPANSTTAISVALLQGVMEVRRGTAATRGANVSSDAAGRAVTSTTAGHKILGKFVTVGSAADDIVEVLLGSNGEV